MDNDQEQFKKDLLDMEDIIDKCIIDGELTIGTGCDPLFVQIMDKSAFGEDTPDKKILNKMECLCRKTLRDNLLCLFAHVYIRNEYVICFGVTEGKDSIDFDFDIPKGSS